jgi:hypothetical protein
MTTHRKGKKGRYFQAIEKCELDMILWALDAKEGMLLQAADLLEVDQGFLSRRCQDLGISHKDIKKKYRREPNGQGSKSSKKGPNQENGHSREVESTD